MEKRTSISSLSKDLPPEWPGDARLQIRKARASNYMPVLVILSDSSDSIQLSSADKDNQVNTYSTWETEDLVNIFTKAPRGFIISSNFSQLESPQLVNQRLIQIRTNVNQAAHKAGTCYELVLAFDSQNINNNQHNNSDSPHSVSLSTSSSASHLEQLVQQVVNLHHDDVYIFLPSLPQTGLVTIDGVYYNKQTEIKNSLASSASSPQQIPQQQATQKEQNGYSVTDQQDDIYYPQLNLKNWLSASYQNNYYKNGKNLSSAMSGSGSSSSSAVIETITIDQIRIGGPNAIRSRLESLDTSKHKEPILLIVNALSASDIDVFVAGYLEARMLSESKHQFFCFSSPAYISSRLSLQPTTPISYETFVSSSSSSSSPPPLSSASTSPPLSDYNSKQEVEGAKFKTTSYSSSSTSSAAAAAADAGSSPPPRTCSHTNMHEISAKSSSSIAF